MSICEKRVHYKRVLYSQWDIVEVCTNLRNNIIFYKIKKWCTIFMNFNLRTFAMISSNGCKFVKYSFNNTIKRDYPMYIILDSQPIL